MIVGLIVTVGWSNEFLLLIPVAGLAAGPLVTLALKGLRRVRLDIMRRHGAQSPDTGEP